MTTPIEMMIDEACGVSGISKQDKPEEVLLALAAAAKDWNIFPSEENAHKLREAATAWEEIGG
jgi:hypothetical protein